MTVVAVVDVGGVRVDSTFQSWFGQVLPDGTVLQQRRDETPRALSILGNWIKAEGREQRKNNQCTDSLDGGGGGKNFELWPQMFSGFIYPGYGCASCTCSTSVVYTHPRQSD